MTTVRLATLAAAVLPGVLLTIPTPALGFDVAGTIRVPSAVGRPFQAGGGGDGPEGPSYKDSQSLRVPTADRATAHGVCLLLFAEARDGDQAGPGSGADDPRVKAAVDRAAAFLRSKAADTRGIGELSLMAHALAKIRVTYPDLVPADDRVVQGMIEAIRSHWMQPRDPAVGGPTNYEAACAAMALAAAGGDKYKLELTNIADYFVAKQMKNGAWSYTDHGLGGDTSQTQYAILGLWEAAASAGVAVPPEVWDKAAQWLISTQTASGGFAYHPKNPEGDPNQGRPTHTMTMASLGSLYICRDNLQGGKQPRAREAILTPVGNKAPEVAFKPAVAAAALRIAIDQAAKWMANNFTLEKPRGAADNGGTRWLYYYLYALERYGSLANVTHIAGIDWFAKGAELVLSKQQNDGSWKMDGAQEGPAVQTSFAALFLVRSTMRSIDIHRQRLLGRDTLVGARKSPMQLLAESERPGVPDRPVRIPGDAAEQLRAVEFGFAIGNFEDAELAALRLARLMHEKPWKAVGDEGDRLRKMLRDGYRTKSSEVLKTALRLLALTGDYRVVPLLIDGMYYEDDRDVQLAAREALCVISRKFHGFGSAAEPTLEEWETEISHWQAWYASVRPQAAIDDDVPDVR